MKRIAIVGAGLAGCACAAALRHEGFEVDVYEKSRGAGGRAATRRVDDGRLQFDHGAQYFTVRDERLRRHVDNWLEEGVVGVWDADIARLEDGQIEQKTDGPTRYVGTPKMSAVAGHLAEEIDPHYETRVGGLRREQRRWVLVEEDGEELGSCDALVLTPPAEQTRALLDGVSTDLRERIDEISLDPTWAVMLAVDEPLSTPFDAAFVDDSPLAWVARDSSKPGRPEAECWVLHSTHRWARQHLEASAEDVAERLVERFFAELDLRGTEDAITYRSAHRWRYAEALPPLEIGSLVDASLNLAVAGDWLNGSRIEGAFTSGCGTAARLVPELDG